MNKMLLAGAALLAMSMSTHATESYCAVVLKTRDGWLNLRDGPGTNFKVVTKLYEGDLIDVNTVECIELSGGKMACGKHEWTFVFHVPRIGGDIGGWVRNKYIQSFACREDQLDEAREPKKATEPQKP